MHDLEKISSSRLFAFWKDFCIGILVLMGTMLLAQVLPYYFAPIPSLIGAAVLYTMLYNNRLVDNPGCMVMIYALFYCLITYSFATIILNLLYIWGMMELPKELTFIAPPYIPSLLLDPICFVIFGIIMLRLNSLSYCMDCKFKNGLSIDRGKLGQILHRESRVQILNLLCVFGGLSIIVWAYYFTLYDRSADINTRDRYIFFWLNLVIFLLDGMYFAARYYNIYLDQKERGNIITEEELSDMTTKTYLRFYVICGNSIYVNPKTVDPQMPFRNIIDTPFVTKRNVNGISTYEVNDVIHNMVQHPGHLKFFYGRRNPDMQKHRLLRYFYFLDGSPEEYPELNISGEWMDFNRIKSIYNSSPTLMAGTFLADMSRMSTVVLTQKIFDDRGFRKIKVKSYQPNYDLNEIRDKDYDFQDDKWIRVAMFNSDTKGFHVRRIWQKFLNNNKQSASWRQ
jgi:membrane protein